MKKAIRFISYFVAVLVLGVGILLIYVKAALPDVGEATELKIDYTPERIQRGAYLANSVTICMDCHSKRDWSKFSGPPSEGSIGMGGDRFDQTVGMPGVFYAKNITPEGIARYTDGELFRVITTGVTKEGRAMFPLMPYTYYGRMDPEGAGFITRRGDDASSSGSAHYHRSAAQLRPTSEPLRLHRLAWPAASDS